MWIKRSKYNDLRQQLTDTINRISILEKERDQLTAHAQELKKQCNETAADRNTWMQKYLDADAKLKKFYRERSANGRFKKDNK